MARLSSALILTGLLIPGWAWGVQTADGETSQAVTDSPPVDAAASEPESESDTPPTEVSEASVHPDSADPDLPEAANSPSETAQTSTELDAPDQDVPDAAQDPTAPDPNASETDNPPEKTAQAVPDAAPVAPAADSGSKASKTALANAAALAALSTQLDDQMKSMQSLQSTLTQQQSVLDSQKQLIDTQKQQIDQQQTLLQSMNAQISQIAQTTDTVVQDGDTRLSNRLDTLEQQVNAEPEDPLKALEDESFPGSWRIPGTNSAMRIGGYVKMNIVNSFDPLVIRDRFIVGSIPAEGEFIDGAEKGAVLTAQQSRVNLDLRDNTEQGMLRAFVEGDFFGEGETFRMRHAYGQFRSMLAGKTWSTMMNLNVTPEEVDFEGINGRINVRQPQLRFFPSIGKNLNFRFALEDPAPDISGAEGANTMWDLIASLDWSNSNFLKEGRLHGWTIQTAVIGRQLKARVGESEDTQKANAWGLTASGAIPFKLLADQDKFLWQVTYGDGIGRYINDLGTIGGQDGIIAPDGTLKALPVFAGYLSLRHWWTPRWRSNATFSWVKVDTFQFQSDPAYVEMFGNPYEQTLRASGNVIFSPAHRLELGAELLWGERRNANDTKGDAVQLQLSARYLY